MLSEFGLIEKFRKLLRTGSPNVKLGIGDDAAVLVAPRKDLFFTCDCVVENIHFDLSYFSFFEAGWRLACANLSDIAAMGGRPWAAIVTLGVRPKLSEKNLLELYRGMKTLLSKFNCPIVGGDVVRAEKLFADMAMLGVAGKKVFTRSGAKPNELVVVTGDLGRSLLGFRLLAKKKKRPRPKLTEKHLRPYPRLLEADFLVKKIKVGGMIDISDGLSSELHHLSKESRVGFVIEEEKLPRHPALVSKAQELGLSAAELALSSGEEYELLFTCAVSEEKKLLNWNRRKKGAAFNVIGRVVRSPKKVFLVRKDGKEVKIRPSGFRHF
jgi:thiamine-monophosphate kinase